MPKALWISTLLAGFLLTACEDVAVKNQSAIIGYWAVQKAFRDGRETSLLSGVYFKFSADHNMQTNLPNTGEGQSRFTCENNRLIQEQNPPIIYTIKQLENNLLVLVFEMNNTPFELVLTKTDEPPTATEPSPDTLQIQ